MSTVFHEDIETDQDSTPLLKIQGARSKHISDTMDANQSGSGDRDRGPESRQEVSSQPISDHYDLGGMTLYEKKCFLVNNEINAMGMGRYQWCIWGLCGFGYFLDLLWAQAFGLVLSPLEQEFGFTGYQSGQISISFSAGLTAGAAFWGLLVDIIGRQWAFNLTVLISSAFGLGLGGANSYNAFLVLTAFVGFGVGGNIPIDTTITLEMIPQRNRRLLPFLSIFQPIGVVITTAIAYGFIPNHVCTPNFTESKPLPSCFTTGGSPPSCCGKSNNMGWRYTLFTVGAIGAAVFVLRFVFFSFRESPKYLLSRGKDAKAIRVLEQISKFNKRQCTISRETFEALAKEHEQFAREPKLGSGTARLSETWMEKIVTELKRYKLLFSSLTISRLTILIWLTYWCDYWGFTVAGTYLPQAIAAKNSSINLSLRYSYRSYIYIYFPGIFGVLLGVLCYDTPRLGRKWTMVISSGLMGASLFIFATINSQASNIGVNAMEYFFQSMFNAVLYGWTPEAYPAPIRGTACGIASFWGRLAGIISPIIAQTLAPPIGSPGSDYDKLLYLAGGVTLGCVLWTALLPSRPKERVYL